MEGLSEAFDGALEELANGGGVDAEDLGNFAVAKALGAEVKTGALLGGEVFDGAMEQGDAFALEGDGFGGRCLGRGEFEEFGAGVVVYGEVVGDGVDPGAGIGDGLAIAEGDVVFEKRIVGELLGFGGADAEGEEIGVDFLAVFGEEDGDLGVEGVGHGACRLPRERGCVFRGKGGHWRS